MNEFVRLGVKKGSRGSTTQASAAGACEPTTHPLDKSNRRCSRKGKRSGSSFVQVQHKIELKAQGDPDAQNDRRGLPTDRPPDKTPPWKGAVRGSSYERVSSRHVSQLASARGINGLSGNAAPLEKIQIRVQTQSNQCHASAAGSSQGQSSTRRVRSWRHTSGGRSRGNGYVCGKSPPFPNPGRSLFPYGVFLRSTESAGSERQ
jgi:hypothetical protein